MKKNILLAVIFGSAFVSQSFTAAQPATASPANKDRHQKPLVEKDVITDTGVVAFYEATDPTGCIITTILVQASFINEWDSVAGKTASPDVSVSITVNDFCNPRNLFGGGGDTNIFKMTIDPQLRTAALKATIMGFDAVSTSPCTVHVDLTFKATGPLEHNTIRETVQLDGTTIAFTELDKTRPALVKGTVTAVIDGTSETVISEDDPSLWHDTVIHDIFAETITTTKP